MDFDKENKLQKRKAMRYKEFDYNSIGVYFITICTKNKQCMLSEIVGTGVLCQEQDCKQLCKMIVYNFVLVYLYALGSRTERSGGRLPKAPRASFEARNASIE